MVVPAGQWIPACAGMTVGARCARFGDPVPAFAGMTKGVGACFVSCQGLGINLFKKMCLLPLEIIFWLTIWWVSKNLRSMKNGKSYWY